MSSIEGSYVSADGHVVELADLWTTRMDKRFRDRAPRVEARPENDYYIVDGHPPMPVSLEVNNLCTTTDGNAAPE